MKNIDPKLAEDREQDRWKLTQMKRVIDLEARRKKHEIDVWAFDAKLALDVEANKDKVVFVGIGSERIKHAQP